MKRWLPPSFAEVLAVIVGFGLQHTVLLLYHKENHIYSVIHVAIAFSLLAKSKANRDKNIDFGEEFVMAIFGQFYCLLLCQLLSNYGLLGWICRKFCKANHLNFSPIPLKIIEVLFTLTSYLG